MSLKLSVFVVWGLLCCLQGGSCQLDIVLEASLVTPYPNVTATMVLLTFPPAGSGSDPHTHSGPVTGFVLQGEFLFQLNDDKPRILQTGEAFAEKWGDVHVWGANASNDTTCKVMATVMGVAGEPLLTFVPDYPRVSREEALAQAAKLKL